MHDTMNTKQQLVLTAKQMGQRSWSSCKTLSIMGFIFSAAECTIEKTRAKPNITNIMVAGCVTGGTLSARGGPRATCFGCSSNDREIFGDVPVSD